MADIERITDGGTRLGPGTLYASIRRLLQNRLIEESGNRPDPKLDDERRRHYSLSSLGSKPLSAEIERLNQLIPQSPSRHTVQFGI